MAEPVYHAPGAELCEKLWKAEGELGRIMGRPGRSDEALNKARQAVDQAERALRKFSDGRAYDG
jgi:hypothetical protein